jgi:pilus assembly protein TadC
MAGTLAPTAAAMVVLTAGAAGAPRLSAPRRPVPPVSRGRGGARPVGGWGDRPASIVVAAVAATIAIGVIGLLPTAAVVIALVVRRPLADLAHARRARRRRERDLPDAIELLVLTVHAGLTPHQAVRDLADTAPASVRPAFESVTHRLARGAPLADALVVLRDEIGPTAGPLVDAIAGAERYGLPLAPVLERLADEARAARHRLAEADARRLPVKLSFPLVACTLPSFILLAIAPSVLAAVSSLGSSAW